ncbi:MAG: hypothetical protein NTW86_26030 [Candidatus Sumerlaeota bacterium]|nr:hypothetical protein [Candidatus Sumerlaeota bacterium]
MRGRTWAIAMAAAVAAASLSRADTLILKNGKQIRGVVRDIPGDKKIQVKTDSVDMWIDREQVAEIRSDSTPDFVRQGDEKAAAGDVAGARAAYRQALDLDPKNDRAKQALAKIDALSPEERKPVDPAAAQAQAKDLIKQARNFLDRASEVEALEALAHALELDPANVEALMLAARTSLKAWSELKVPANVFAGYIQQLEKTDPQNREITVLKEQKATLDEKRKMSVAADRQRLFDEIQSADHLKKYDGQLLIRIERLMEMDPDPAMKARLEEIRKTAEAAGAGKIKIGVSSSIRAVPAPAAPGAPKAPAPPSPPTSSGTPPPSGDGLRGRYYDTSLFTGK